MRKMSATFCLALLVLLWAGTALATDHSFIEGPLNSGPEATKACLECHEDAADHIMKTSHWTWDAEQTINGKQVKRGKVNAINNFCIGIRSNEPRCHQLSYWLWLERQAALT